MITLKRMIGMTSAMIALLPSVALAEMMDSNGTFEGHGWMGSMMGGGAGVAFGWITMILLWILLVLTIVWLWQRINRK